MEQSVLIDIKFSIWMASKTRWVHLTKTISLPAVPRSGDFIKFTNEELGDYFAWEISEVTYRESGSIEVSTALLDDIDNRRYSFEDEAEFDEYYDSYIAEGWTSPEGIGKNRQYRE